MKALLGLLLALGSQALRVEREPDGDYVPKNYKEMWFTADIDNFSYLNHTFPLRYYIKDEYWNETGPIFFYCGNEGDVNMFLNNSGFIDFLGDQMNALIVFAEHRYFGKSLPYGLKSFSAEKYRRYLSPHQALADFARLLNYLKDQHNNAPVIAWGGSYGGMLAAWFRIKYPNIVHGAIAASAPINHFYGIVDPFEFNEIVTNDYAEAMSTCPGLIHDGFTRIKQHSMNSTMFPLIQQYFNTCQAIETADDLLLINDWMENAFVYMAMTDYPYATNFLTQMPAHPVNVSCSMIHALPEDPTDEELFRGLKKAADVYYSYNNDKTCSDTGQHYDGSRLGQNGWDYLACSTLNMPISSNGVKDMFLNDLWDQKEIDRECLMNWDVAPQLTYPQVYYGASKDPASALKGVTNIVFSNGNLDPWQSGSVLTSPHSGIIAFVMHGAAHHLDLRYPNPADPPEVNAGRGQEKAAIEQWLAAYIRN